MEETTPTKPVIELLSIKVKQDDKNYLNDYLKAFEVKHIGFSEFVKLAKQEPQTVEVPVHQNLDQLFDFEEYKKFVNDTDTSILDAIKRALKFADNVEINKTQTEAAQKTITDFVPADLVGKVNLLHRDLKMKGKAKAGATDAEYLEALLTYSLKYFLLNEYPKIYNR